MSAREQVTNLREGDVVELRHPDADWTITGPLVPLFSGLGVAGWAVTDTHPNSINAHLDVRVIKRASRPLYVNHPRTEPVPGDVVRDADDEGRLTWRWCLPGLWVDSVGERTSQQQMHTRHRLRLLVDGETGQSVGPDAAEGWAEGFEAAAEWLRANPGPTGIPHDPPSNPYLAGQVVPS